MPSYISSNNNRFYVAPENTFGQAAVVSAQNRFPANKLELRQAVARARRPDKTGTRTYLGQDGVGRRDTEFLIKSYLACWDGTTVPHYGALFQAATGGIVEATTGNSVAIATSSQVKTSVAHGLTLGSAIATNGEVRFIVGVPDSTTVMLNVPFTRLPQAGDSLTPTTTYRLGSSLPSLTLYDYWDPVSAISRIATGAAVDKLRILVNGDYHEFLFSGPAADLLDSQTFQSGDGGLASYPVEPALSAFNTAGVPGHLGHAWIGGLQTECLTLCNASIQIENNLGIRDREFGAVVPRAVVPGERAVTMQFSVLAQDDSQTLQLYTAAKERTRIPVMLQLGVQQGRLLGIYMPNVVPELPEFDDEHTRLRWTFSNNVAQGSDNDEIYLAFA